MRTYIHDVRKYLHLPGYKAHTHTHTDLYTQITDSVSSTGNRISSKVHWRKLDLYCTRPEEEYAV